jgi:hypothetical protein
MIPDRGESERGLAPARYGELRVMMGEIPLANQRADVLAATYLQDQDFESQLIQLIALQSWQLSEERGGSLVCS